jgi:ABC-type bacteriocin/lantibiotic exporter with double-glycine peptidase domain
VSRLSDDIGKIQQGLSVNVAMFIRSMIFVIVSFVFLFVLSWQLTLTILVSISPVIVYSVFFGNVMKKTQKIV